LIDGGLCGNDGGLCGIDGGLCGIDDGGLCYLVKKTGMSAELIDGDKPIAFDEFKAAQTKDVFDFRDSSKHIWRPLYRYICMYE